MTVARGLPRALRLRSGRDFRKVLRDGLKLDGPLFILYALDAADSDRLGLAVSRRVGDAVERNRAKRLLREAFRQLASRQGPGRDLVAVAKPGLPQSEASEVQRELSERLRRLSGRPARRRPSARRD